MTLDSAIIEYAHRKKSILNMVTYPDTDPLRITFCGRFKSGKTSLVNALLGVTLLPVRTTTATAVVTKVFFAETSFAYTLENKVKKQIPINTIHDYILAKEKSLEGVRTSGVTEIGIGIPSKWLRNVMFVDTPGLDDDDRLTEMSLEAVRHSDLAVIVYDATQLLSRSEKETFMSINKLLGGNVVFVINRIDSMLEGGGSIKDIQDVAGYYFKNTGNSCVGKGTIFYTSASGKNKDITHFEKWIKKIMLSPEKAHHIRQTARTSLLDNAIHEQLALIGNDITMLECTINELKQKNQIVIQQKNTEAQKQLQKIRYTIDVHHANTINKVLGLEDGLWISKCRDAFEQLKQNSGWEDSYHDDTKKFAKKIIDDILEDTIYQNAWLTMVEKDCHDAQFDELLTSFSRVFQDKDFPKAYTITHSDGDIGVAIAAGLGAFALSLVIPGVGAVAGIIGFSSALSATKGAKKTIKEDCVTDSINFIISALIPSIRDLIDSFFTMLKSKVNDYDLKKRSYTGGYEKEIGRLEFQYNQLKTIQTSFYEIKE